MGPVLQVGVKILLQNAEGKYLLLRRSAKKYPEVEGRWDIPGGRIDPGTSLLENLKREVKEETSLDLVGEPKLIAAQDIFCAKRKHIVRLTYRGHGEGELGLDTEENDEHCWCTFDKVREKEDLDVYLQKLLAIKRKW